MSCSKLSAGLCLCRTKHVVYFQIIRSKCAGHSLTVAAYLLSGIKLKAEADGICAVASLGFLDLKDQAE